LLVNHGKRKEGREQMPENEADSLLRTDLSQPGELGGLGRATVGRPSFTILVARTDAPPTRDVAQRR